MNRSIQSAALVVNTQSRRGRDWFKRACARLRAAGLEVDAHAVDDPAKLEDAVRAALARQPEAVILGGGDGTISCLVDLLVGRDVKLGVLPLGTANSFARSLGLPLEVDGAVDAIVHGVARRIDLGRVGDDYFANTAAIGLSPQIARTVPHAAKRYFGRLGYLAWASWQFVKFRPFAVTVTVDGATHRHVVTEVRISNGPYHGGTALVDAAAVDSGQIVVQLVTGHYKRRLVRNWVAGVLGLKSKDLHTRDFRGAKLDLATVPALPISIDGEVLATTPTTVSVAPGAIEVLVPR